MTTNQAITILKKHNQWRRGGKGEQQDPKLIGEAIDVCVHQTGDTDGKEYILNVRNELLVKRLKWTHEQLIETREKLEWTESERRRLKEKSDKIRKELYQLKNKQS